MDTNSNKSRRFLRKSEWAANKAQEASEQVTALMCEPTFGNATAAWRKQSAIARLSAEAAKFRRLALKYAEQEACAAHQQAHP